MLASRGGQFCQILTTHIPGGGSRNLYSSCGDEGITTAPTGYMFVKVYPPDMIDFDWGILSIRSSINKISRSSCVLITPLP